MPWTGASTPALFRLIGTFVLLLALAAPSGSASGQSLAALPAPPSRLALDDLIAEAAQRFGIPEGWIRSVMRVESAFDARAVSHAGAMGLMQVMPQTYAELRVRYGLGADPFQPRDNILAGAAYLREMYDRFGAPGFLAAYNAGPARYQEHVATGRPLPLETRAYVAKLTPGITGTAVAGLLQAAAPPPPETLFVALGAVNEGEASEASAPVDPAASPLFAPLSALRAAD